MGTRASVVLKTRGAMAACLRVLVAMAAVTVLRLPAADGAAIRLADLVVTLATASEATSSSTLRNVRTIYQGLELDR